MSHLNYRHPVHPAVAQQLRERVEELEAMIAEAEFRGVLYYDGRPCSYSISCPWCGASALDRHGAQLQHASKCRAFSGPGHVRGALARLDEGGMAKPKTEIVGVFPRGERDFYDNADELLVRPKVEEK